MGPIGEFSFVPPPSLFPPCLLAARRLHGLEDVDPLTGQEANLCIGMKPKELWHLWWEAFFDEPCRDMLEICWMMGCLGPQALRSRTLDSRSMIYQDCGWLGVYIIYNSNSSQPPDPNTYLISSTNPPSPILPFHIVCFHQAASDRQCTPVSRHLVT